MFAKYLGTEVPASSLNGDAQRFFYSVTRDSGKGAVYLKLVNASSVAQPVEIEITGATNVVGTATVESLTGVTLAETNTISSPTRIVPVQSTMKGVAAKFSHSVPPYTIQVLELQAK
jgi:alpha-N-arabinofuranosidase